MQQGLGGVVKSMGGMPGNDSYVLSSWYSLCTARPIIYGPEHSPCNLKGKQYWERAQL